MNIKLNDKCSIEGNLLILDGVYIMLSHIYEISSIRKNWVHSAEGNKHFYIFAGDKSYKIACYEDSCPESNRHYIRVCHSVYTLEEIYKAILESLKELK